MLAIVVVHWNTPDLLASCLASLEVSPSTSLAETIVVDCASETNELASIVERYEGVKVLTMERNDGYAAGCNAGARVTSAEVILFLNADTEVTPGALDLLLACFELNPRIGLVAPLLLNRNGSIQSSGLAFPGLTNVLCDLLPVPDRLRGSRLNGRLDPGNLHHPYAVDYALGAAVAVRATALEAIGGWDESYGMYAEEVDLARRLADTGWTRLLEPRARIVHVGGASTGQRPAAMQAALWRSRGRYHRLWSSPAERLVLRSAIELATRVGGTPADRRRLIREAFAAGLAG